jgi:glyoxylase I family protein
MFTSYCIGKQTPGLRIAVLIRNGAYAVLVGIRGIRHAAISTPDLDRAIVFWGHLGFSVTREWEWQTGVEVIDALIDTPDSAARAALLEGLGTELELFEFAAPPQPSATSEPRPVHHHGYTHLCFEVDAIDVDIDRLASVGMTFWGPPIEDRGGQQMIYGRDPDGNVIELVQPPDRG